MRIKLLSLMLLIPATIASAQQGGIEAADKNGDKKVDAKELKTYVSGKLPDFDRFDELFKELDQNKDGSIDATEFAGRMQAIQAIRQRPKPKAKPKGPTEFVEMYDARFAKRKPQVGETIDGELAAFDGSGKPFRFKDARGKYTVIVFGCLT